MFLKSCLLIKAIADGLFYFNSTPKVKVAFYSMKGETVEFNRMEINISHDGGELPTG